MELQNTKTHIHNLIVSATLDNLRLAITLDESQHTQVIKEHSDTMHRLKTSRHINTKTDRPVPRKTYGDWVEDAQYLLQDIHTSELHIHLDNNVHPKYWNCLMKGIALLLQYNRLKVLHIRHWRHREFPIEIAGFSNLEELVIQECTFTELPEALGQLTNLRTLKIENTPIRTLPQSMGNWKELHTLEICRTHITQLPDSFTQLTKLLRLKLLYNKFLTQLPTDFGKFSRLYNLDIWFSKITQLPDSFGALTDLRYCTLYGLPLRKLPDVFESLSALTSFYITNTLIEKLPLSLQSCRMLNSFTLNSNNLLPTAQLLIMLQPFLAAWKYLHSYQLNKDITICKK